jgi:hypothetical protein
MWLISTAETGVPSGSELILVLLDDLLDLTQLYPREPLVPNQLNIRLKPELGLSVGTVDVNVWPWLLPGEKEEPITLRPQDCRAHGT